MPYTFWYVVNMYDDESDEVFTTVAPGDILDKFDLENVLFGPYSELETARLSEKAYWFLTQ